MSFENYTICLLRAFQTHSKQNEIIKKKQEIIYNVSQFHNFVPNSILYVGFNPAILMDKTKNIYVTKINDEIKLFLKNSNVKFEYIHINNLSSYEKFFDVTIALDEYFTFSETDQHQKNLVNEICFVTKEYLITTCKDYKNQEFKDKEFSIPAVIKRQQSKTVFVEYHDHDQNDKNIWSTEIFEIVDNNLVCWGPYARRAMFFKQLAKFSADSGAVGFSVHKNLMYKSLIKKNYEHVISIRFENGS